MVEVECDWRSAMSLGWLNLQDYLDANQGAADDMAQRLDAQQQALDTQATQAASRGDSVSYGQFLAKRRTMASQRGDETGRAALLGGEAADSFLAGRGRSNYQQRATSSADAVRQQQDATRQREADYWQRQAERNRGLAQRDAEARRRRDESVTAAKRAMEERAGGPGYRAYSDAVRRSFDKSRGKQVRVISEEESKRWG